MLKLILLKLALIAAFALASVAPLPAFAQDGYQGGDGRYQDGNNRYQNGNGDYRDGDRGNDRRGPGGGYDGGQRTIVCESWKYQPTRCDADTRGGVRLVHQNGGNCIQGRTWGFDRGGIWVNNGCRAVFAVSGGRPGYGAGPGRPGSGGFPPADLPGGGNGRIIACSSLQYQPARCAVDVYHGADLVQDVSSGHCKRSNWGWDRGGVWVNNGCRGTFRVY